MNSTTRRAVLAGTAAAIPAVAFASVPAHYGPDPVFAAIERHRAAYKAHGDFLRDEDERDLWIRIPEERRRWHADIFNPEPPADCGDDPEWIAYEKTKLDAGTTDAEALVSVVSTEPATIAGAVALLNYCLQQGELGASYSGVGDEAEAIDLTATLLETLAAALPKMAA